MIKSIVKSNPVTHRLAKLVKKKLFGKRAPKKGVPFWFKDSFYEEDYCLIKSDAPTFLYIPWIAEHGNVLIDKIKSDAYNLVPLHLMRRDSHPGIRRKVFSFARSRPEVYRKMILRKLLPVKDDVSGVVLTFDWAPVMRVVASVCHELDIPVILIPHESVFVDRNKYYWDPISNASLPVSDFILCWGQLQKDIFIERGYPEDRIEIVGAPKFDCYHNYFPVLTKKQFCSIFGLSSDKKVILFASQPLDSQYDIDVARDSQRAAIKDLYDWCAANGCQLLVRLPPSKDNILGDELYTEIESSGFGALDDANFYTVTPEEAIYHSDIITSVNSTMLFEGVLLGKPSISTKYIEFDQIWENVGIPSVKDSYELSSMLTKIESEGFEYPEEGLAWAKTQFSYGEFSGKACENIRGWLSSFLSRKHEISVRSPSAVYELQEGLLDVVAVFSQLDEESLKSFLARRGGGARHILKVKDVGEDIKLLASSDIFFISSKNSEDEIKSMVRQAKRLGKDVINFDAL